MSGIRFGSTCKATKSTGSATVSRYWMSGTTPARVPRKFFSNTTATIATVTCCSIRAMTQRTNSRGHITESAVSQSGFSPWACNHYNVAVGVAEPHLSMPRVGIDLWFLDDLGFQRASTFDRSVEVVQFEPYQDSMSNRRRVGVDEIGVIL